MAPPWRGVDTHLGDLSAVIVSLLLDRLAVRMHEVRSVSITADHTAECLWILVWQTASRASSAVTAMAMFVSDGRLVSTPRGVKEAVNTTDHHVVM